MLVDYKREFIDFALSQGVLKFGSFELKSGRASPYFFNAGEFKSGQALQRLGDYYAAALVDSGLPVDCLLGPAYKGIPLVSAAAISLAASHGRDLPFAYNRKEIKDHGEGGFLVGAALKGDVIVVDDVITAGTAIREVMSLVSDYPARIAGVMVAIDRMERGQGKKSAIQELESEYSLTVVSVVNLDDIVAYLLEAGSFKDELEKINAYRNTYGIELG